ncbi:DNA replication/repair protein RecF [Coralliovum pocilloporae]|uniref:DNA replication/repair protein RecF n=1 Tax=Coralliovum pocilloporae TaxID=3066369 RepID=UPI0033074769
MTEKRWLSALRLSDFRNYTTLSLAFAPKHIVFTGENGAGKTNLLEAVSFLSPGRGMRRAAYGEVSRQAGEAGWAVVADIGSDEGEARIGTGLATRDETARQIRIDGDIQKTSDSLLEHVSVMWLTPAMDGLFTGPGADRRKFLDRMVLSLHSGHGRQVSGFEKSMRSRNRLLEDGRSDPAWLDAIEMQMAEHACAIGQARRELVDLLASSVRFLDEGGSAFPAADIALEGEFENDLATLPASDAEENYRLSLRSSRPRDRAAGRTLSGPHRADLKVRHQDKDMPAAKCSTGEQKALLLGLVLSHAHLVGRMTGKAPLMLLDEVAAHLDERRRDALFDLLDRLGCQALMTGTDRQAFTGLGDRAQFVHVSGGTAEL